MTDDMTNDETANESSDENQLTIRRTFDAPRERVYRAFTDPDELEQWFVPQGMEAEVHALEPESGGAFAVSYLGDESRIDNEGTFVEVVENERLGWVEEVDEGESRVTVDFADVDDGTEVALSHERPGLVAEEAAAGWEPMLDNLDEVLP